MTERNDLVNVQTLAFYINSSVQTISMWYRWKKLHPEHELAKLLPDYIIGSRGIRLWKKDDIWKLTQFKQSIPQGRNGIMGEVTQMYSKSNFRKKEKTKK